MSEILKSDRSLSEVIGMITLLGLIVVILAVHVSYSVPADGRSNEIRQMNAIKNSFTGYKTSLDSLWINAPANPAGLTGTYGITAETDIVLGTAGASKDFISLFPLLKPAGSFGSIRVNGNDGTIRIIRDGDEELLNISIGSMRYESANNYWVQQEYIYQMGGVFLSQQGGVINKISPTFSVFNKSNRAAISITPVNVSGNSYISGGGRITMDTNLISAVPYYPYTLGADTIRIEMDVENVREAEAWEKVFRDSAYMNNLPSGWYSTGSSGDTSAGNAYVEITGPTDGEGIDVVIDILRADFLTKVGGDMPGVGSPAGTGTTPPTTGTATATATGGTPPTADFSANITSGTFPLTVQFTDLSSENPTGWSWTFGDGETSGQQNPVYTYESAGTYTVSLTASNQHGSDIEIKTDYIEVSAPPLYDIIVNTNRNGISIQAPGYLEFRVTGGYNYISIDGLQYPLATNDIVRLTINSDTQGGTIGGNSGSIYSFSFDDVTLEVNDVNLATGEVTGVWIADTADHVSTLVLLIPAVDPPVWTQFRVDGVNLISGSDGREILLSGIVPDTDGDIYLVSGGSYQVLRSSYTLTPPL